METKVYGYVRVSSKDQNEERQVLAMRQFGIPDERTANVNITVPDAVANVDKASLNDAITAAEAMMLFRIFTKV